MKEEIHKKKSENDRGKKIPWLRRVSDKLTAKDAEQAREGFHKFLVSVAIFAAAYATGHASVWFGVYPFGIALLCATSRYHFSVLGGLILSVIFSDAPTEYLYAYLVVFVGKLILNFLISTRKEDEVILKKPIRLGEAEVSEIRGEAQGVTMPLSRLCVFFGLKGERSKGGESTISGGMSRALVCGMALLGAVVVGLFGLMRAEFSFYSLCGFFVCLALSPLSALILRGYDGRRASPILHAIAMLLLAVIVTYASHDIRLFGMSLSPMLALLFSLLAASRLSLPAGIAVALSCTLAFDFRYLPLTVISVLLLYFLSYIKRSAGVAAVCGAVVLWCYFLGGSAGMLEVLPAMLFSIPEFLLIDRYFEMRSPKSRERKEKAVASGVYFAEAISEKNKNDEIRRRMNALSDTFGSLSETFFELSDRFRRPDLLGLGKLTEECFERGCEGCRNRDICRGVAYSETLEAMRCVASALHEKGKAEASDLPSGFRVTCLRTEKLLDDVNRSCNLSTENIIKGGQIGAFASNCDSIREILRDALECDSGEYVCNMEAGGEIYEHLSSVGISVKGVVVWGKRCCHVTVKGVGFDEKGSGTGADALSRKVSEIVGTRMDGPVFEVESDGTYMSFSSRPTYHAVCAHGHIPSHDGGDDEQIYLNPFLSDIEGEVCGDHTDAFSTENSYFYSLISDGMGSGAEASFTSGVCAMFIEKMLSAGNRADITLRMLNTFLRSENLGVGDENSATVDLLELDLIRGVASFLKGGAAPTYILRGGRVYKVSSPSMPMGIIKNPEISMTKFETMSGDIIVMISDGCCPDSDECPWLVRFLNTVKRGKETPEELAESIKQQVLELALENYPPSKHRDDISASVVIVA